MKIEELTTESTETAERRNISIWAAIGGLGLGADVVAVAVAGKKRRELNRQGAKSAKGGA